MLTRNARRSVAPIVLSLTACLTIAGCGENAPTAPESAVPPFRIISEKLVVGPGGLEGLRQDIAWLRGMVSDPTSRVSSDRPIEEQLATLESVLAVMEGGFAHRENPSGVKLQWEIYDTRVQGESHVYGDPWGTTNWQIRFFAWVGCHAFENSNTMAEARALLRGYHSSVGEFMRRENQGIAYGIVYGSGTYEYWFSAWPTTNPSGTAFTMDTRYYCKPGFGDDYFKTGGAIYTIP